jgi:hypothetical protein
MENRESIGIGIRLIEAADAENVTARLLGGVAVAIHSATAGLPGFRRTYEDVDIVIDKRGRKRIDAVAMDCGFLPDTQFNNLHGLDRRTYYSDDAGKLDVFIGDFSMCHTISFDDRLNADHPTVALADLLLTKAQIYELNRKDAFDLLAILADHPIGTGDDETINVTRIASVCGKDWGTWRTVIKTLDALADIARAEPEIESQREGILVKLAELRDEMERAPKSAKWKMRSKVGERKIWYDLPEDPDRHPAVVQPSITGN